MTNKLKGNKKKITAVAAAIVIAVAAVAGIAAAVRATTSTTVSVIPVSELNNSGYTDWSNSVSGMITTEAEQRVYLSDTEKVAEVMVQEGQAVHKDDVLLRYDTESTMLSLEKEKVNRDKIELDIVVAKENIKILANTEAVSDGDGLEYVEDFEIVDPAEVLSQAQVQEKIITADAKPVSEGSEYEILGTADAPYVFLCKGESVIVSADFIKKWQKTAAQNEFTQLYIELEVLDSQQELQKAWITDIMLLDPQYDIEVDLTTGKTAYAAMNDPEKMSVLLRKILVQVPKDERGAWLAALLDKLMILTEKEEQSKERGELLAAMLCELGKEEQADFAAEFAAAASLLDEKTLSVMFKSLAENLTAEQVEGIDKDALSEMLVVLLSNIKEEQVQAIDPQVLTSFLGQLSQEQIRGLDPGVISAMLAAMSSEQIEALDSDSLSSVFAGLSQEQMEELDAESLRHFFGLLNEEQLGVLLDVRGDEIRELLKKADEEKEKENEGGSGNTEGEGGSGSTEGEGGSGNAEGEGGSGSTEGESSSGSTEGESSSGNAEGEGSSGGTEGTGSSESTKGTGNKEGQEVKSEETSEEKTETSEEKTESSEEKTENSEEKTETTSGESVTQSSQSSVTGGTTPSTASDTSSGGGILSMDTSYTSDGLAKARREAQDKLRDLELSLKESELKIEKAQKALDEGVVKANMNGIVKSVSDPASPPADGSAFITVAGSDGLFVKSGIKESMIGTLGEGDLVTVTSWQTGGQYEAEIKSISPYPDSTGMFDSGDSQTYYPFTANILDKNVMLQNGEWVEVSYVVQEDSGSDGIILIKAFVREEGSRKYVYVRDENGMLRKQYIVTGTLTDAGYEVLDGLNESDWIAFPYGKNVKEGAKTREGSISDLYE